MSEEIKFKPAEYGASGIVNNKMAMKELELAYHHLYSAYNLVLEKHDDELKTIVINQLKIIKRFLMVNASGEISKYNLKKLLQVKK